MSEQIVVTVDSLTLVGPDGPVRVTLTRPVDQEGLPNDRRGVGITLIVPIEEALTFYPIGGRLDLNLLPHAEEHESRV